MIEKKLYDIGNLRTGYPYGVVVNGEFGTTELHGPFATENEAWNYGQWLATYEPTRAAERVDYDDIVIVKIETPHFRTILTGDDVREYRKAIKARDDKPLVCDGEEATAPLDSING